MGFSTSYDTNRERVAPGEYECIIHSAAENDTYFPRIQIELVIRTDVTQPFGGYHLWYSVFKPKAPSAADEQAGGYSIKMINSVSRAAEIPDGKQYDSVQAWLADLPGRTMRVPMKYRAGNNGREYPDFGFPEQTRYPMQNSPVKGAGYEQVADVDFPF